MSELPKVTVHRLDALCGQGELTALQMASQGEDPATWIAVDRHEYADGVGSPMRPFGRLRDAARWAVALTVAYIKLRTAELDFARDRGLPYHGADYPPRNAVLQCAKEAVAKGLGPTGPEPPA
jgi:hypothetical protein